MNSCYNARTLQFGPRVDCNRENLAWPVRHQTLKQLLICLFRMLRRLRRRGIIKYNEIIMNIIMSYRNVRT